MMLPTTNLSNQRLQAPPPPQTQQPTRAFLVWLAVLFVAALLLFGVRFSDGGALLAIARGADLADSFFSTPATQYVWDSPLKIFLLRFLPANIVPIAVAFSLLAVLPLAALLTKNRLLTWLAFVACFLTPALKVSLQNIGVGDGLVILCAIVAAQTTRLWLLASAFLLIALWHPQQAFFMGLSYVLSLVCYADCLDRKRVIVTLGTLAVAAAAFFAYKFTLGFQYVDRFAYMLDLIKGSRSVKNLVYAPIAFAPLGLWLFLAAPQPLRAKKALYGWILILASVSLLTTDVTRVVTLTSLPIVLAGARILYESPGKLLSTPTIVCALLVIVIPPYSWSGLDFFLWPDFIADLCKWKRWCL